jgi:6-phosphogluconolactonase (cycloisomerase 2 family)
MKRLAFLCMLLIASLGCSNGSQGAGGTGGTGGAGGTGGESDTAPILNSVDPEAGIVGTEITITGSRFGGAQGDSTVRVGDGEATVTSWSDTQIEATVGNGSYPGEREIEIEVNGETGGGIGFDVQLPPTLYINNDQQPSNSVSAYRIDPATGGIVLIDGSPYFTGGAGPEFPGDVRMLALHEGTRRLFASNVNSIAVFDIDPVTGAPTVVDGSPFGTNTDKIFGLAVAPDGAIVYAAAFFMDSVVIMDVAADGTLSENGSSPVAAVNQADIPVITPDGAFLYVNGEGGEFAGFAVNADGTLAALDGSPFEIDKENGFAFFIALDTTGDYLYIPDFGLDAIYSYSIDGSTGAPALTAEAPQTANGVQSLAFTPDGNRLFAAQSHQTTVYRFPVLAGGDLSPATSIDLFDDGLTGMAGLGVTANGRYLYVIDEIGEDINVYNIDAGYNLSQAVPPVINENAGFSGAGAGMSGHAITRF